MPRATVRPKDRSRVEATSASQPQRAAYLYCVVRSVKRPSVAGIPAGLPGSETPSAIPAGPSLWLIVSQVPLDRYGPEQLEKALRDLEWVSTVAVAHEAVVEHFASRRNTTVVPMKLFTMFSAESRAVEEMRSRRKEIEEVLKRIAGCEEWGVRIMREAVAAAPAATPEQRERYRVSGGAQEDTRRRQSGGGKRRSSGGRRVRRAAAAGEGGPTPRGIPGGRASAAPRRGVPRSGGQAGEVPRRSQASCQGLHGGRREDDADRSVAGVQLRPADVRAIVKRLSTVPRSKPPHQPPRPAAPKPARPSTAPQASTVARIIDRSDSSLLDVIDNLLNQGVVLNAELILSLANVDLVFVRLSALLCAADRVLPDGRPSKKKRR